MRSGPAMQVNIAQNVDIVHQDRSVAVQPLTGAGQPTTGVEQFVALVRNTHTEAKVVFFQVADYLFSKMMNIHNDFLDAGCGQPFQLVTQDWTS